MMAQEAALKKVATGKSRRLLAYNKSSKRTDVQIDDTVLLPKAMDRKSAPRRRGPAKILDIDEPGETVKPQPTTF